MLRDRQLIEKRGASLREQTESIKPSTQPQAQCWVECENNCPKPVERAAAGGSHRSLPPAHAGLIIIGGVCTQRSGLTASTPGSMLSVCFADSLRGVL
jgi:hypothetical protein